VLEKALLEGHLKKVIDDCTDHPFGEQVGMELLVNIAAVEMWMQALYSAHP